MVSVSSGLRRIVCLALLCLCFVSTPTAAWEWSDIMGGSEHVSFQTTTLTMMEVSEMRVRDLRRRLTRRHGYSAEEVGRILDKKELIHLLSFEEHKEREKERTDFKREVTKRAIVYTFLAVVLALFWPLLFRAYEVATVNFIVYKDRKIYETKRCFELKSVAGFAGIIVMAIMDVLQLWLSTSVLLSWVMKSKYFFPTPSLTVNPAKMMGGEVSKTSLAQYGLNVGPMVLTWVFRFLYSILERWTGKALANAHQHRKREARDAETPEEKAARKAMRKAAKRAARKERDEERRKQQEEEQQRRREAADKATASLFPKSAAQQQQQQTSSDPSSTGAPQGSNGGNANNASDHGDLSSQQTWSNAGAQFQSHAAAGINMEDLD